MDMLSALLRLPKELYTLSLILLKYPLYCFKGLCSLVWWPQKSVASDIVLITGGASGIGKLMAIKFAELGSRVVIWDLNEEQACSAATEINEMTHRQAAWAYACDVTDRGRVYALAKQVTHDVGAVSILVNNAGIVHGKKLLDADDALMEKVVEVNSIAHFWTVKAFLPEMLENNYGHVVTIASMAGKFGAAGLVDYCASKFAAVGLNDSLRLELRKLGATGVKTTVICPYLINTGMFDGAKTRAPWFLPILHQEYAASRIMQAIRRNQAMLFMPRFLYFADMLASILPSETTDEIAEWMGASETMNQFKGRQ